MIGFVGDELWPARWRRNCQIERKSRTRLAPQVSTCLHRTCRPIRQFASAAWRPREVSRDRLRQRRECNGSTAPASDPSKAVRPQLDSSRENTPHTLAGQGARRPLSLAAVTIQLGRKCSLGIIAQERRRSPLYGGSIPFTRVIESVDRGDTSSSPVALAKEGRGVPAFHSRIIPR